METEKRPVFGGAVLTLTAMIWGFAFVAQSVGMDYMKPLTFQSLRTWLGCLTLLPVLALRRIRRPAGEEERTGRRQLLTGGLCCGLAFTLASCLQQTALQTVSVGKAGFLTSLYLVLVPLFGIFLGQRLSLRGWFSVLLCLLGVFLLSVNGSLGLAREDILLLLCAVCFAVQIQLVDHFVARVDGIWLSFLQLLTSAVLTGILAFAWDRPSLGEIAAGVLPLLYAGVCSCGIAYTLQIVGQKHTPPAAATVIMSLESVFSLLGGVWLLGQIPTARELAGGILIFAAVILIQLPERKK